MNTKEPNTRLLLFTNGIYHFYAVSLLVSPAKTRVSQLCAPSWAMDGNRYKDPERVRAMAAAQGVYTIFDNQAAFDAAVKSVDKWWKRIHPRLKKETVAVWEVYLGRGCLREMTVPILPSGRAVIDGRREELNPPNEPGGLRWVNLTPGVSYVPAGKKHPVVMPY